MSAILDSCREGDEDVQPISQRYQKALHREVVLAEVKSTIKWPKCKLYRRGVLGATFPTSTEPLDAGTEGRRIARRSLIGASRHVAPSN
jgi:hypothetical protein